MAEQTQAASDVPDEPWPRIVRPPGGKHRSISGTLLVLRDADGVRVDMSPGLPMKNQLLTLAALLTIGAIVAGILWGMDQQGTLQDNRGAVMALVGFGGLTALFFAVNPYIRRAALKRLGPAAVLDDDGTVRFPQRKFSVRRDEIIALHAVHGVYVTTFQRTISRHPVVQLFVEHEADGERHKTLAHLGPSNNDVAFREFAEQELGVPFTSHKARDYMKLSHGSVSGIRGM